MTKNLLNNNIITEINSVDHIILQSVIEASCGFASSTCVWHISIMNLHVCGISAL